MNNPRILGLALVTVGFLLVSTASILLITWFRSGNLWWFSGFVLPATMFGALVAMRMVSLKLKVK